MEAKQLGVIGEVVVDVQNLCICRMPPHSKMIQNVEVGRGGVVVGGGLCEYTCTVGGGKESGLSKHVLRLVGRRRYLTALPWEHGGHQAGGCRPFSIAYTLYTSGFIHVLR